MTAAAALASTRENLLLIPVLARGLSGGFRSFCVCGAAMPVQPAPYTRQRWVCAACARGYCVDCFERVDSEGRCVFGRQLGQVLAASNAVDARAAA